jgi:5'-nucleotidase
MVRKPIVLVTNDDGINAEGLQVLVEHLSALGDLVVAAPDQEQSAVGHGISLARPLRVVEQGPHRFAISGTPADCVLLALFSLCPRRPSLVVSGINLGLNVGTDVFYSGTLAGALEGAIHEVPAIAVSQELPRRGGAKLTALLARTARFAVALGRQVLSAGLPSQTALNVNAPAAMTESFRWTRHGRRAYREQAEQRADLRGVPYYWIGGPPLLGRSAPDTDAHAVDSGLISVTPLGLDLTTSLPCCYDEWRPSDDGARPSPGRREARDRRGRAGARSGSRR